MQRGAGLNAMHRHQIFAGMLVAREAIVRRE